MLPILVYRHEILPISETFIQAQSGALTRYRSHLVGLQRANPSLPHLGPKTLLSDQASVISRLEKTLFLRIGFAPRFYRRLRTVGGVLLHCHFATDAADCVAMSLRLGIPMVVSLHGYDVTLHDTEMAKGTSGRRYLAKRQALWDHTSLFVCVSDFVRQKALQKGFPPDKLVTHYIGIDTDVFYRPDRMSDRNLIVFVGRLAEKKGCKHLLNSAAAIMPQVPGLRILVVGDGPELGVLRVLARDLGLDCRFLGAQDREFIRSTLMKARVFCAPSVTAQNGDSEGLGLVFAEAQAMGVPVVSFRHGGIPEVVLHGETGLLASEGDVAGLADYLRQMLCDDELHARFSAAGVKWIQNHFSLHRQTAILEDIYNSVITTGGYSSTA